MERSWIWRRTMAYVVVLSCLAMLAYALIAGGDGLVAREVVQAAQLIIIGVAAAYFGVAAWDDQVKGREQLLMSVRDDGGGHEHGSP